MATSKTVGRRRVTFVLRAEPGSEVCVGGTFNDWDASKKPMKETEEGVFQCVCMIPPGIHEYKFQINGNWCVDPDNPNFCQNSYGSLNSVVEVS